MQGFFLKIFKFFFTTIRLTTSRFRLNSPKIAAKTLKRAILSTKLELTGGRFENAKIKD